MSCLLKLPLKCLCLVFLFRDSNVVAQSGDEVTIEESQVVPKFFAVICWSHIRSVSFPLYHRWLPLGRKVPQPPSLGTITTMRSPVLLFLHLQCENKTPCFKTFRGLDRKMVLSMCKPLSYLKNSRSQDQGQEQQKERQRKMSRPQAGLLDHPLRRRQLCSGFLTDFINDSEQNWYNIWHPVQLEYILHEQQIPRNDHKRWYSSFSPELNSIKLSILMHKLHKCWHCSSSASPLFPFCRCHNRILSLRFIFAENQNTLIIWQMRFHGIIADSFN